MEPATVIELQDVWVHYETLPALESVNLTVHEGDFLGVIGPNGGGKTTLLKVILGLVEPTRGRVRVLGDVPKRTRSQIGYVPQYTQFDPAFPISVEDVVMAGRLSQRRLFRRYTAEDRQRVTQALERVGLLDQRDRQMSTLSGGQQQRVLIARALVSEPKLLLLDEPMAGVDSQSEVSLYELLQELNEQIPIILVSHDIGAISAYVKQIACVNRTLFYHPSSELTIGMLEDIYQCPVEVLGHGVPHRVLKRHEVEHGDHGEPTSV